MTAPKGSTRMKAGQPSKRQQDRQDIQSRLTRILDALRQGGMPDPVDSLEQAALLVYMKLLDEREPEKGSRVFPAMVARYRWSRFRGMRGRELRQLLASQVIPYLSTLDNDAPAVADYYRGATLKLDDPSIVEWIVREVDAIDFYKLEPDEMGIILEELLAHIGIPGEFRTPAELRELMITLVDPTAGQTIYDPACGTAGFLTGVVAYLVKKHAGDSSFHRTDLGRYIFGNDNSQRMVRLALMNLELQGIGPTNVRKASSVSAYGGLLPDEMERKYDVVICAPPFGDAPRREALREDLPVASTRLEILFLEIAMTSLKPGGRAAIVLPDHLLESAGATYTKVRGLLVAQHEVLAVIPLPASTFRPHSWTKTSIVVFRCPGPAKRPGETSTRAVWFPQVQALSSLNALLDEWHRFAASGFEQPPGIEAGRVAKVYEQTSSWWASAALIKENQFDLSASRYQPRKDILAFAEPDSQISLLKETLDRANDIFIELEEARAALRLLETMDFRGLRKLRDLVAVSSGQTPRKDEPSYWDGKIPWVSPKDMKRDIIEDTQDHVSDRAVKDHERAMVEAGSVLVVQRSMILERKVPVAIASYRMMISQDLIALKPHADSGIDAWYLFAYLTAMEMLLLTRMRGTTHGSKSLPRDVLLDLDVPLPTDEARAGIGRLAQKYVKLSDSVATIKQLSDGLFTLMLRDVFHGERGR